MKPTAIKIGKTSLRDDKDTIYAAVHRRIDTSNIQGLMSETGETFELDSVYFCVAVDGEDKRYDIETYGPKTTKRGDIDKNEYYYTSRCLYYKNFIQSHLMNMGLQREDMYTFSSLGEKERKTEYFHITNPQNQHVLYELDNALFKININVNAHLWRVCAGCGGYARQENGQECKTCSKTWCHESCILFYLALYPGTLYTEEGDGEFICKECS
jgi:hypothetical protein